MNRFETRITLLSITLVAIFIVSSVLVLTIPRLEGLLPYFPFASALVAAVFAYLLFRTIRSQRRQLKEDIQTLAEMLATGAISDLPENLAGNHSLLAPFVSTVREIRQQILRSVMEAETTARVVGGSVNRTARMLDQFTRLLHSLEEHGNAILAARKELEYTLETETEQSNLAEQIVRIRVELENFEQIPKEMVELLKHTYAEQHQERTALLDNSERLAGDINGQLNQIASVLDGFTQQHAENRKNGETVRSSLRTFAQKLSADLQRIQDRLQKQQDIHSELAEKTSTLSDVPEQMQTIHDAVAQLDTTSAKLRILVLNAAIFAADAGESGHGFNAIARDMKEVNQETERTQNQLKTQINQLEQQLAGILEQLGPLIQKQEQLHVKQDLDDTRTEADNVMGPLLQSSETLAEGLHQQADTCEQFSNQLNRAQATATQGQAQIRKRKTDTETVTEQKYRIDRMVIETDRFSERVGSEVPGILRQFGSILDQVASLQDRFTHVHDILVQFIQSEIPQEVDQLKTMLQGPDIQLLRDVPKLLNKSHRTLKSIEPS